MGKKKEKERKKCIELMESGKSTQKEIASAINVSQQSICAWKKEKKFMEELDRHIKTRMPRIAVKALKTQGELLDAKNEMVRYLVSKDILDRGGYKVDGKLKTDDKLQVVVVDDIGGDNN